MRTVHVLKLVQPFFEESWIGAKTFELRVDDRDGGYKVGDILHMREWRNDQPLYTGREIISEVTYTLKDERFLQPGVVAMGTRVIERKGQLR